MTKHVLMALIAFFSFSGLAEAARPFLIGQSDAKNFQAESRYSIEFKLSRSTDQKTWNAVEEDSICYGDQAPCGNFVGRRLARPSSESGAGFEVWQYGIVFDAPDQQGAHQVAFPYIHGIAQQENGAVAAFAPSFILASSKTTLGTWNQTVFVFSAQEFYRLEARLVARAP